MKPEVDQVRTGLKDKGYIILPDDPVLKEISDKIEFTHADWFCHEPGGMYSISWTVWDKTDYCKFTAEQWARGLVNQAHERCEYVRHLHFIDPRTDMPYVTVYFRLRGGE